MPSLSFQRPNVYEDRLKWYKLHRRAVWHAFAQTCAWLHIGMLFYEPENGEPPPLSIVLPKFFFLVIETAAFVLEYIIYNSWGGQRMGHSTFTHSWSGYRYKI